MRRFALDTIWRSLTGHPLDDGTERELAAVEAVGAALPTLPADTDAQDAVAADLARIDAVAGTPSTPPAGRPAPTARACCTS